MSRIYHYFTGPHHDKRDDSLGSEDSSAVSLDQHLRDLGANPCQKLLWRAANVRRRGDTSNDVSGKKAHGKFYPDINFRGSSLHVLSFPYPFAKCRRGRYPPWTWKEVNEFNKMHMLKENAHMRIHCEKHLPIRKIMVAPTYDRERTAEKIKRYCWSNYWLRDVDVTYSQIPFIPPSE